MKRNSGENLLHSQNNNTGNSLQRFYADAFDFLMYSVLQITDMACCSLSIYEGKETFKITSYNPSTVLNKEEELKFKQSFPILDNNGITIGEFLIYDMKDRVLSSMDLQTIDKAILQICKQISATKDIIAQQKQLEAKLKTVAETKEKAIKTKLVTKMNHAFRTPLNGIIGFSDLALRTDLDTTQREYLEHIHESGLTLCALINDMDGFCTIHDNVSQLPIEKKLGNEKDAHSKSKTQEAENNFSNIKRALLVDDSDNNRRILRGMLEAKNIEVVEADNGLKALLLLAKKPEFDVIIIDHQMPIMDGMETIKKMKQILAAQGNKSPFIVMYSALGNTHSHSPCEEIEGYTRLVKPIRREHLYKALANLSQPVNTPEELEVEELGNQKSVFKVLIAEDNAVNMALTKLFTNQILPNAVIIEAINGREAISLFQSEKPDIVLMDIQMPIVNGFEATKKIRGMEKQHAQIPIIAITANDLPEVKEKCFAVGMNDFLAKPLFNKTFSDTMGKWLGVELRTSL